MKLLFPTLLLAAALAGCSTRTPTPDPTLTGGSWRLQSDQLKATPLSGAPGITSSLPLPAGAVKLTYADDTHFSLDLAYTSSQSGYHFESGYDYYQAGGALNYQHFYDWNARTFLPGKTVQVTELSAHRLITTEQWVRADTSYVAILTYAR